MSLFKGKTNPGTNFDVVAITIKNKKPVEIFSSMPEIIEATEEVDWVHRMEGYGEAYSWEGFEDTVCNLMERKGLSSYPKFVTVNRHYTFDKEKGEKYKNDTKYEE